MANISKSVSFKTSVPIFIQIMLPFKYPADDDPKVQARGEVGGEIHFQYFEKNMFLHFWKWPSIVAEPQQWSKAWLNELFKRPRMQLSFFTLFGTVFVVKNPLLPSV